MTDDRDALRRGDDPAAGEPPTGTGSDDPELTGMLDALRDDPTAEPTGQPPAQDAPADQVMGDQVATDDDGAAIDVSEPGDDLPGDEAKPAQDSPADAPSVDDAVEAIPDGDALPPDAAITTVLPPVDDSPWWDSPWADEQRPSAEPVADAQEDAPLTPEETGVMAPVPDIPRDVDLGPSKRAKWWVIALAAVVLIAAMAGVGYAWWWSTSRAIIVPDVVGKRPADATQTLNDVGLRLGKVSEVPTDSAPVGTIISQNPEAGSRLKPDDSLSFVVAATPEQAKVPNVAGLSAEQAAATLAEARLRPFEIASYNTSVAADYVVAQLPDPGTELVPGSAIAVIVSRGPAPTAATVPRVTGMAEADALTLLKAVGFQPRVYRSPDASLAVGVVGTQTPLPGVAAAPGSVVQVLVSQGAVANAVTVPEVTNQTRKDALDELTSLKLKAEVVVVANPTVARGRVIAQMPQARGRSAPNGTVGILVSRGNVSDGPVPSLVGTASTEATRAITSAGFRPVVLTLPVTGGKDGTVFAQYPAPGVRYAFRLPVVCLVAKPVNQ